MDVPSPQAHLGELLGFDDEGRARVALDGGEVVAQTVTPLGADAVGERVALLPLANDAGWLVVGRLLPPGPQEGVSAVLEVDGERATLTAKKRISLRCGKASVELTRAGKIILRGTYVASESEGLQHLRGAVVEVN